VEAARGMSDFAATDFPATHLNSKQLGLGFNKINQQLLLPVLAKSYNLI
jgi:hypothetical protein